MPLEIFHGKMKDLEMQKTRVPAGMLYRSEAETERDKKIHKGVAVVAALVGNSAAASSALHNSGAEIPVTLIRFTIDEKTFFGMFSDCPFTADDEIAIISRKNEQDDFYHALAIARPADRLIILKPNCTRGRRAYFVRARKRWAIISVILSLISGIFIFNGTDFFVEGLIEFLGALIGCAALYAFIEWRLYVENDKPLVHLTEEILATLGLQNPQEIDLVKFSKKTRKGDEPVTYVWNLFRY